MAISATQIATSNTLENFRQQFNNLQTDVNGLESGTLTFSTVSASTLSTSALNVLEDGTIVFEGATDDGNETTLTVADPSADRTITLPDATGTVVLSGSSSFTIADAGTIGSASDTDAIAISSAGVVSFSATTANTNATDGAVTIAGGLGVAADASVGDDLRLISDSAVLSFGADSDTTLTHTDGTGLTLNSTNKLTFGDAASFVQQSSDGVLRIDGEATIDLNASTAVTVSNDLKLDSDSAVLSFGSDSEITLTHVADTGLTLTHTASGDDKPIILQLKSEEDAIVADEVIASLEFAAGDSDGTDGATVAAGIHAIAEDTFSASVNSTKLVFTTGASETAAASATAKMTLSSAGLLTIADDFMIKDGGTIGVASANDAMTISSAGIVTFKDDILIKDGGTIGVASAATAITIASTGIVTFVDDIIIKDAGTIGSASDTDAISISSGGVVNISATTANTGTGDGALTVAGGVGIAADASIGDDLRLISDSAVLSFGADSEITLTHVADTGLTLTHTASGDDKPIVLNLKSEEDALVADEEIGRIDFTAGDSDGTDAILTAASIAAIAEDTFAADNNSTGLAFKLGVSAAATEMFRMDHDGDFKVKTDGSAIGFGADNEIELTHVHDTGLLLTDSGGSPTLQLHDSAESVSSDGSKLILTSNSVAFSLPTSDGSSGQVLQTNGSGVLSFTTASANTPSSADGQALGSASLEWSDLFLADGGQILFGNDQEITLTHVADSGLTLKHADTADDKFPLFTLAAGDNDIAVNDVLGRIAFIAPDEGAGTDAILNAGVIDVFSEGDFSASNNAASMRFSTGNSAAAGSDGGSMILNSTGNLTLKDLRTADGSSPTLTLQTGDTDIAADDILGTIAFQAPDEGAGTDALLVAGNIDVFSEGDFSSSNNAASMRFTTGKSAAAGSDGGSMILTSTGNLTLKDLNDADGSSPTMTFQTGDTDIAANDVLGTINFQAPDEGTGTDAILVAAGIEAVSEGDFSSSNNATKLVFKTAASEAAASKMTLSSGGVLDVDGGITVDNITIDGTEIDLSSGSLTIDVASNIILDANGGEIQFHDNGTEIGAFQNDSNSLKIESKVSDADTIFAGNDGGTGITALTLDMSAAGAATFNADVTAFSDERLKTDIETIENAFERLIQLRGVYYRRTDSDTPNRKIGVIAQEVEKHFPEVVLTADDDMGTKSVDYGKLTAVLIESVKELGEVLNSDINTVKKQISSLKDYVYDNLSSYGQDIKDLKKAVYKTGIVGEHGDTPNNE